MAFATLPSELVLQIMQASPTLYTAFALASTCRQLHSILHGPAALPILYAAASRQYGPLPDAIQLLTHNSSQPAHHIRSVAPSLALLKQIVEVGRVANAWVAVYPFRKWKEQEVCYRRLLITDETFRLRRAVYRLWLYAKAFHNASHPRTTRTHLPIILERAELLRCWSNAELMELIDLQDIIRDVLQTNICPSNSAVARKHRLRHGGDSGPLLFTSSIHLNNAALQHAPSSQFFHSNYHTTHQTHAQSRLTAKYYDILSDGWGDEINHYYVIEDMLKLDPRQVLILMQGVSSVFGGEGSTKSLVRSFVASLGESFDNNGSTFGPTLEWVIRERGLDWAEIQGAIDDEIGGVVGV